MVSDLISYSDGQIIINSNNCGLFLIPEFKELLTLKFNKDKGDADGRKKKKMIRAITYIYMLCDPRSPISHIIEEEREERAKVYSNFNETNSDIIRRCVDVYKDIWNNDRAFRLLRATENFIDKQIKHLDEVDFTEEDANNKLKYDITKYSKLSANLSDQLDDLIKVEKKVKESFK